MLLLWLACGSPSAPPKGSPAPGIEMLLPEALKARLEGPATRPRVYNFWATWCGPCVKELPAIVAWGRHHPEVELTLVDVDVPRDKDRKVVPFVQRHQLTDVTIVQLDDPDPAGVLPHLIENWPDVIPVTLVVAPDGSRIRQFNGDISGVQLDGALDLLTTPASGGIP
jgi:thiol-disulfide isomerase/thioredoxin